MRAIKFISKKHWKLLIVAPLDGILFQVLEVLVIKIHKVHKMCWRNCSQTLSKKSKLSISLDQ